MSVSAEDVFARRQLSPRLAALCRWLAIGVAVLGALYACELQVYLGIVLFKQQFLGALLGLIFGLLFLLVPARDADARRVPFYDVVAAAAGTGCGMYAAIHYPQVAYVLAFPSWDMWAVGAVAILLILELSRRLYGGLLSLVSLVFLAYAAFADLAPGFFKTNAIPWDRLVAETLLGSQGLLGMTMEIIATVVLVYIVFGEVMFAAGGSTIFSDLALALMGRYRGGPAKVAVLGSALFGSISGSAIANIAVVGNITIPLMKKTGYRPEVAAAVEATASTGGLIMPPVMGAIAFIVAEYLQISYGEVILAAVIPALLYYGSILVQVDLEAARYGMKGLAPDQIPRLRTIFGRNWPFLLPLVVLIVTLVALNWSPTLAGMLATALAGVVAIRFGHGRTLKWWLDVLERAGRSAAEIVAVGSLVGIIVVAADLTGLGYSISFPLIRLGQQNFFLFLLVTALTSLVLGMGLPGIVIYIMQAALIVPILVKMGVQPLAAHFFIMYFGTFAMITPPVAIASIAAAGLAKSDPWKTGIEATKLGAIAFVVPFMFVVSPSLLFIGPAIDIVLNTVTALLGIVALGVAFRGFLFAPVSAVFRAAFAFCATGLILPVDATPYALALNIAAFCVAGMLALLNWRSIR